MFNTTSIYSSWVLSRYMILSNISWKSSAWPWANYNASCQFLHQWCLTFVPVLNLFTPEILLFVFPLAAICSLLISWGNLVLDQDKNLDLISLSILNAFLLDYVFILKGNVKHKSLMGVIGLRGTCAPFPKQWSI